MAVQKLRAERGVWHWREGARGVRIEILRHGFDVISHPGIFRVGDWKDAYLGGNMAYTDCRTNVGLFGSLRG